MGRGRKHGNQIPRSIKRTEQMHATKEQQRARTTSPTRGMDQPRGTQRRVIGELPMPPRMEPVIVNAEGAEQALEIDQEQALGIEQEVAVGVAQELALGVDQEQALGIAQEQALEVVEEQDPEPAAIVAAIPNGTNSGDANESTYQADNISEALTEAIGSGSGSNSGDANDLTDQAHISEALTEAIGSGSNSGDANDLTDQAHISETLSEAIGSGSNSVE